MRSKEANVVPGRRSITLREWSIGGSRERLRDMAQRVNVVLVDDIDGDEATETVAFALDGVDYEIDLNESNAKALRDSLERYVEAGRRVGGRRRRGQRGAAGGDTGPSAADIRKWARENGWDVPERGRVSADVREAYAAAH